MAQVYKGASRGRIMILILRKRIFEAAKVYIGDFQTRIKDAIFDNDKENMVRELQDANLCRFNKQGQGKQLIIRDHLQKRCQRPHLWC